MQSELLSREDLEYRLSEMPMIEVRSLYWNQCGQSVKVGRSAFLYPSLTDFSNSSGDK